MVSNSLRQLLQSLCCDSPWDYAVFWRLQQHQNQMLLTWEDGSFDISRIREPKEDAMDSFYCNWSNEGLFACQSDDETQNLAVSPIGVIVAEMSSIYYVMGKGIVGEVFHSESPSWIFADSIMAGGCDFNLTSECPDELLHQFVAGIKTILLVPLVPFGVLQLGSMDKVVEDAGLVTCVKNNFEAHQLPGDFTPFSLDRKLLVQPPEVGDYTGMKSFSELSGIAFNTMDEDLKVLERVDLQMPNPDQMMSMAQNLYGLYHSDMSRVTDYGIGSKINVHSPDTAETFMYPMFESGSEMTRNFLRSSCIDEEMRAFFSGHEMGHDDMTVHEITESYSNEGTMEWLIEKEESDNTIHKSESQLLRFPSDCELHKALGSALRDHVDLNLLQPASSGENSASDSVRKCDMVHCIQPYWNSGEQSTKEKKAGHLLEAIVGNGSSMSDDSSSQRSHSTTTSLKASSGRLGSPQTEQGVLAGDDHVPWSCVTSVYTEDSRMHATTSPSSLDCMINALIEHQLQRDDNNNVHLSKGSKPCSANKRRGRHSGNHKPRPRDRQLIQDRIKELRELVPQGSKCSIDGLLVRAIKHMQFLRRVTDQAGKIEQHLLEKGSDQKSLKAHAIKSSGQNGTSWALEVGCDQQTCPIIVKDLEYPGNMLIEMVCNDHGRFLEIADVICRLELTILKGVMERRSDDSTWAHFIVEASGNFHRLDIFWPLMQLLQQNRTQISSKI